MPEKNQNHEMHIEPPMGKCEVCHVRNKAASITESDTGSVMIPRGISCAGRSVTQIYDEEQSKIATMNCIQKIENVSPLIQIRSCPDFMATSLSLHMLDHSALSPVPLILFCAGICL
jgi:hypothetical protein